MPIIVISIIIQLALVVHIMKTGRNTTWVFIVLIFPLIGSLAYCIIELLPELRAPQEGIWALYPHNRHLSPKVRLLVDYLAERLSDPAQPALVRPIG